MKIEKLETIRDKLTNTEYKRFVDLSIKGFSGTITAEEELEWDNFDKNFRSNYKLMDNFINKVKEIES